VSSLFREPAATLGPLERASAVPAIARLPEEWDAWVQGHGGRKFQGKQIFEWIHKKNVTSAAAMTNLPAPLRAKLTEEGVVPPTELATAHRSTDGTRKWLVRLADAKTIETVLIPSLRGVATGDVWGMSEEDDQEPEEARSVRVTQCISSQVGCAMGCVFCASGVAGLERHLGPHEIVGQVLQARAGLDEGERLSNVVFMGMGEPLHNYDAVARALRLLTHPDGIGISKRKITVSTSGLIPEIERLGKDFAGGIGLAISLHATDDDVRSKLMPINKKYPLGELMAALRRYPIPPHRRITIEYTLVSGKNDTVEEAERLARLLRGLPVKVNLIPMNPIEASTLGPPDMQGVTRFQRALTERGYDCFVRRRRGDDVAAACGQLALLGRTKRVRVLRD
jgi:23S rRNA (adenine2503-C2)-methyltransferase